MTRRTTLLLIAFSSALILGLWLGAWYVGTQLVPIKAFTNQPLADVFSSINALFAGFAFCGVILTVYLQIQELQDTRQVLAETSIANKTTADYAKESAIVDLFQTYCSEYFQKVKNSSMSALIPAMASREYFEFMISRFFVAEQKTLSKDYWPKISKVSRIKSYAAFEKAEQDNRYKLDELINFFTILAYQKDAGEVIARCDFSYSWWRPMFWMIAIAQEIRYQSNPIVRQYATALYFKEVVKKLDQIYGFTPIASATDLIELIKNHPKLVHHYKLDAEHLNLALWQTKG